MTASKEVELYFYAIKGFDPNIYRDGKLVSQGVVWESEKERFSNLKTTITHRGKFLSLSTFFSSRISNEDNTEVTITIKAKTYRNNQLLQNLELNRTLNKDSNTSFASFDITGNPVK